MWKWWEMTLLWGVIGYVLYLALLFLYARIIFDWVRQFSRSWRPGGIMAVGAEVVYVTTDPPIRLLRRLVPPLRIGTVSLDLSVYILMIVLLVARYVVLGIG